MKHMFLLLLLIGGAYSLSNILSPDAKTAAKEFVKKHVTRLTITVVVLFLCFFAAVQNPSFQLF